MKLQKFLILLLALCLAGCSFNGNIGSDKDLPSELVFPVLTESSQTETAEKQEETVPPPAIQRPEPMDADFVRVKTYIPDIQVELRYATTNNFTGQKIYDFSDAYLRYGTVKKLMQVQEELKQEGLYLKIWDAFRPTAAQFQLWEVYPDPVYVANPNYGFSSHSRGNTVDITLVTADGTELVMPTGFDDFSTLADRDYSDCTPEAAANARLLEACMEKYGFKPYSGEWWHFSDTQYYDVEKTFEPTEAVVCYATCDEPISMKAQPNVAAEQITAIADAEELLMVAKCGEFAAIEYRGCLGYVPLTAIGPADQTVLQK